MKKSHKKDWHDLSIGLALLGGVIVLMLGFFLGIGFLFHLGGIY